MLNVPPVLWQMGPGGGLQAHAGAVLAEAEKVARSVAATIVLVASKKRGDALDPEVLLTAAVDTALPATSPERHHVSPQASHARS